MGFRDLFKSSRSTSKSRSTVTSPPTTTAQATWDVKNSVYNEPLQTATTIRLLVLAPSNCGDELICETLNVDLDAKDHVYAPGERLHESMVLIRTEGEPLVRFFIDMDFVFNDQTGKKRPHPYQRYNALSYCWGDTANPKEIIMNGHRVSVTQNLYVAMKKMRSKDRGMRLWIDALSINQQDMEEKATQIGLMTRIYRQAEMVYASVAPEFDIEICAQLFVLLKMIVSAGRRTEALEGVDDGVPEAVHAQDSARHLKLFLSAREHAMEHNGLPPIDDPMWRAWRQLFSCAYFSRIWILQEYVVAKDTTFIIGALQVKRRAIEDCMNLLSKYSISPSPMYISVALPDESSPLPAAKGLYCAQRFARERYDLDFPNSALARGNNLLFKLQRGRTFDATQPRDMLFALLGISSDGHLFQDLVSYVPEVTTEEICMRFAKRFVEQGQAVEVLYQARTSPSMPGLPSWVPYWPTTPTITRIAEEDNYKHYFTAAGGSSINAIVLPDNKLKVRGALCDVIASLSDPLDPQATQKPHHPKMEGSEFMPIHYLEFMIKGGMFSCSIESYPTGESKEEVLFRTMVRGPPWHHSNRSEDIEELKKLREAFWLQLEGLKRTGGEEESPEEVKRKQEIEEQTAVLATDSMPRAYKRRFCLTERGYFGFVPNTTEVGDRVAIVLGGPVPFVLRDASNDAGEHMYELIGDGYFHGLMHGKALELPDVTVQDLHVV